MGDSTQSPLAMLVLVTPYTILYLINQLFLNGILDNVHYVFFELIFVLAFRKVFGLPDLTERLFPAQVPVHTIEPSPLAKTTAVDGGKRKVIKRVIVRKSSSGAATGSEPGQVTTPSIPTPITIKKKKTKSAHTQAYAKELAAMEKKFLDYVENTEIWEKVFEEDSPTKIEVYQYKARPMCYKVIAVMHNTAAVTFDLLSEISRRVEWDPLCVEAKTLAEVAPGTKIQYVRTKGMWPTASRDTVVLGTVKDLGDGRYCNVTSSVEHSSMPERVKEKIVRMETAVAGQIIGPEPGQPTKCRLVQVLDADLKGWIPEKVIQLVSTKAVPEGMRNVNNMIPSLPPYEHSKILERVTEARKEAEAAIQEGGDAEEEEEEEEVSHELKTRDESDQQLLASNRQRANGNGHHELDKSRHSTPLTFRVFWDGIKQNLGYKQQHHTTSSSKANKVIVMTLFLAVFGRTLARYRRRR
ncbi:hypothetical protein EMPS_09940 [Entomortierella parvispora]|uniref:START domain-containing protein n=1 Tax=Entomortierella parvispora TaxID=205924 RepID=A0A9P3HJ60_9FUNG|nr:hypothetical protein EMPS_09940 [Entomortierella parvispora]